MIVECFIRLAAGVDLNPHDKDLLATASTTASTNPTISSIKISRKSFKHSSYIVNLDTIIVQIKVLLKVVFLLSYRLSV